MARLNCFPVFDVVFPILAPSRLVALTVHVAVDPARPRVPDWKSRNESETERMGRNKTGGYRQDRQVRGRKRGGGRGGRQETTDGGVS